MNLLPFSSIPALLLISSGAHAAQAAPPATAPPESVLISASALPGANFDPDKLPVTVDTLSPGEISRFGAPDVLSALQTQSPGVSFSDAQDNPFQPNLFYRGFEASPLAGDAQGLAVYADGVRLNQPFGDTVNWDLVPAIAIDLLTVESSNPIFGLNALGGSVAMQFKNGFSFQGNQVLGAAGSFGRFEGAFQSGVANANDAFYAAGNATTETGWRQHSPSRLAQLFTDFAHRGAGWQMQLDLLGAASDLTGNGTVPVELLQAARSAVFTYPDRTQNTYGLANLQATVALSDALSLQGNIYAGRFRQRTGNGNASSAEPCETQPALLCLDNGEVATDAGGNPVAAFPVELTYGQLDETSTATTGFGGALQAVFNLPIFSGQNQFVAGAAWDAGRTRFSADTRLGSLSLDRGFAGPGIIIDQADGTIAPVGVASDNDYYGLYATDRLDITKALSLSLSGRYNLAQVTLRDKLGTALNGKHDYGHFNPAAGLSYAITPNFSLYGGYSEANRAPTPAEFSCADASAPCSLTNFFVSDPNLKEVVAHNAETGLRGSGQLLAATVRWHADFFRSNLDNDIQFAASPIIGRGFFRNVGETRRQGAELALDAAGESWSFSLDYTYTDATFRTALVLNSPDNPLADANGEIHVQPGDRLPNIPAHLVKALLERAITAQLSVTLAMRAASGVYLRGDESNLNPKTPGYAVFDLGATYRLSDRCLLFAGVQNLFNAKYATFGAFSPTSEVPLAEAPGATNPRSLSPAPPLAISIGVNVQL
jgi:iron complex outermembrane recepter protein